MRPAPEKMADPGIFGVLLAKGEVALLSIWYQLLRLLALSAAESARFPEALVEAEGARDGFDRLRAVLFRTFAFLRVSRTASLCSVTISIIRLETFDAATYIRHNLSLIDDRAILRRLFIRLDFASDTAKV